MRDVIPKRVKEYLDAHPESEAERIARMEIFPALRRWANTKLGSKEVSGYEALGWFLREQVTFLFGIVYREYDEFGTWDDEANDVLHKLANTGNLTVLELLEERAEKGLKE